MLKLGIQFKEVGDTLNIALIDPTKKQLESATELEKMTAQILKEVFDKRLLELLEENTKNTEKIED